jgi:hypothetical protein
MNNAVDFSPRDDMIVDCLDRFRWSLSVKIQNMKRFGSSGEVKAGFEANLCAFPALFWPHRKLNAAEKF